MNSDHKPERSLRELEMEVLEEGREWTRRRLEQRLPEEADRHGGVFPPQRKKGAPPQAPSDASAQRILAFVTQYGLLGVPRDEI